MSRTLIKNGHILTLDDSLSEFEKGYLIIRDDRIEALGAFFDGPEDSFDSVFDAGNKLITPGFISGHDHASNYLAAPRGADGPYTNAITGRRYAFIWRLMAFNTGWTERELYINNLVGTMQYIGSGVTTALDFYPPFNFDSEYVDWIVKAYQTSGMRTVLALGLFDEPESGVNVAPPGPKEEVMALLGDYVKARPLEQIREILEWAIRTHHRKHPLINIMLAPRHNSACSEALHRLIGELSDRYGVGMHTHLLAHEEEPERVLKLFGKPTLQYLDDLGVLNERWSFAHAIYVSDEDIELMARRGVSVVHNPFSNTRAGIGISPVARYLEAGVNVALGSTRTPHYHEALKMAAMIHNFGPSRRALSPLQVLKIACRGGSRAMLMADEIGSLEAGKKADLVFYDLRSLNLRPLVDPYMQLVFGENGSSVDTVMIDGKWVMKGRRMLTFDGEAVLAEAEEMVRAIPEKNRKIYDAWKRYMSS
jgi:cytosine/adenosine deaminase-related metal-dependent hydrolase